MKAEAIHDALEAIGWTEHDEIGVCAEIAKNKACPDHHRLAAVREIRSIKRESLELGNHISTTKVTVRSGAGGVSAEASSERKLPSRDVPRLPTNIQQQMETNYVSDRDPADPVQGGFARRPRSARRFDPASSSPVIDD